MAAEIELFGRFGATLRNQPDLAGAAANLVGFRALFIAQRLKALTQGTFQINPGSLFPALYALERDGKLRCEERPSENNRPARYYSLTAFGRKELEQAEKRWERVTAAVTSVLQGA